MSFSYHNCDGTQNQIDFPRLLISDTQALNHIFEDSEITGASLIVAQVYQSGQFWSPPFANFSLPSAPVSYYRIAALLLDSIASNKARLSSITQLLDVHLSPSVAAKALHAQAEAYREIDDNTGAFALIEQVNDSQSFRQRFWNQIQRQTAP